MLVMKKIENLENIEGGGYIQGACRGINEATAIYAVGLLGNLWNPIGQTGTVVLVVLNVACLAA